LWPKAIGFDAAYQEWFYDSFSVASNVNPTVDGSYDASIHLGTFSFKYLF
jgi:long-chain fatty acid transport protein